MMKNLLLALLLISPFSFADWGDVYYCQMTTDVAVTIDGVVTQHPLQRFTFKLDKDLNGWIWGEATNGYSGYRVDVDLDYIDHAPSKETWRGYGPEELFYYREGKFGHVGTSKHGNFSVTADCEKF